MPRASRKTSASPKIWRTHKGWFARMPDGRNLPDELGEGGYSSKAECLADIAHIYGGRSNPRERYAYSDAHDAWVDTKTGRAGPNAPFHDRAVHLRRNHHTMDDDVSMQLFIYTIGKERTSYPKSIADAERTLKRVIKGDLVKKSIRYARLWAGDRWINYKPGGENTWEKDDPAENVGTIFFVYSQRVPSKCKNPIHATYAGKKHVKLSRADKAEDRVAEALQAGIVLTWSSAHGNGTAGPYKTAADTGEHFAVFVDKWRAGPTVGGFRVVPGRETFRTAKAAARYLVEAIGVANTINALKAAAKWQSEHTVGTRVEYTNLDTPIRWPTPSQSSSKRSTPTPTSRRLPALLPLPRPVWRTVEADRDGKPVERQWELPRMSGLGDIVVIDSRRFTRYGGRYGVFHHLSGRAHDTVKPTGVYFKNMQGVMQYLRETQEARSK